MLVKDKLRKQVQQRVRKIGYVQNPNTDLTIGFEDTKLISIIHVDLYDTIVDSNVFETPVYTVTVHNWVRMYGTFYREVTRVRECRKSVGTVELWCI